MSNDKSPTLEEIEHMAKIACGGLSKFLKHHILERGGEYCYVATHRIRNGKRKLKKIELDKLVDLYHKKLIELADKSSH